MQAVAAENNLSETAFTARHGRRRRRARPALVHPRGRGRPLRPRHGRRHPRAGRDRPAGGRRRRARFLSRSGPLGATVGHDGWIELDFPALDVAPAHRPPGCWRHSGVAPRTSGRSDAAASTCWSSCATRRRWRPSGQTSAALRAVPARGVIVTAAGERSRCRLRVPLLRAGGRHRRGPGDRLGPLRPRALLGGGARPTGAAGPPDLPARRRAAGPGAARRSGGHRRAGGHGRPRPALRLTGRSLGRARGRQPGTSMTTLPKLSLAARYSCASPTRASG